MFQLFQGFCSVVFKLISLQVLALGDAWSLEQRIQSDTNFSSSNVQLVHQERLATLMCTLRYVFFQTKFYKMYIFDSHLFFYTRNL